MRNMTLVSKWLSKDRKVMSSVSTAFKVHYNQKLGGTHSAILGWGNAPWPLGGIDAPGGMWDFLLCEASDVVVYVKTQCLKCKFGGAGTPRDLRALPLRRWRSVTRRPIRHNKNTELASIFFGVRDRRTAFRQELVILRSYNGLA